MSEMDHDVEIVDAPALRIAGLSRDLDLSERDRIPGLWQAWFANAPRIPEAIPGAMYGVSYGATGTGAFSYAVGIEVEGSPAVLPDGLCIVTTSSGPHMVLRRFGPASDIPPLFDRIFSELLPASGHAPREGAVYEKYPDDPRNGPSGMAFEVWVPVTG